MIIELFGARSSSDLNLAIEKIIAELQADISTQKLALYLSQKLDDLKQLLVHFITAQYAQQDTRELSEQIQSVSELMSKEIQMFASLKTGLNEIQNNQAGWNGETLSTLEGYKSLLTERPFFA